MQRSWREQPEDSSELLLEALAAQRLPFFGIRVVDEPGVEGEVGRHLHRDAPGSMKETRTARETLHAAI